MKTTTNGKHNEETVKTRIPAGAFARSRQALLEHQAKERLELSLQAEALSRKTLKLVRETEELRYLLMEEGTLTAAEYTAAVASVWAKLS